VKQLKWEKQREMEGEVLKRKVDKIGEAMFLTMKNVF